MVALDDVRLVALQLNFSNSNLLPSLVKHLYLTHEKDEERKKYLSGSMVIEPTEKCSVKEFVGELETAGYEIVDALHKESVDTKYPWHGVRYLFAYHEFVEISYEFRRMRNTIRAELQEICKNALWRVTAFSKPLYKNNEEIPGVRYVNINLGARQPLFCPDGRPVTAWQRDVYGKKIGNAPLPLRADHSLRVVEGVVQLL